MSVYQLMSSMRLNAVVNPLVTCQACNDIKLPCLKICLEKSLQKKTLVLNRIVCTSMYDYGAFFSTWRLEFSRESFPYAGLSCASTHSTTMQQYLSSYRLPLCLHE